MRRHSEDDANPLVWYFTLVVLQTHFVTKSEVIPNEGVEHCQAGEMSQLRINIKSVENSANEEQLLFYEVICDSNNWAPAGKTSGEFESPVSNFVSTKNVEYFWRNKTISRENLEIFLFFLSCRAYVLQNAILFSLLQESSDLCKESSTQIWK